ncbi:hypothetical protein LOK49_LG06G01031 [Camellia lanceoleosa]|uniref:Uncharacterized protein n=1 Tax=Camellia lanceoleosa TaxID=1840588 RepID=A0ACC0HAZ4_9ERIC|nr:hypothetical protein LOK49_LG06G01031 [Camellia lanceoleosa]
MPFYATPRSLPTPKDSKPKTPTNATDLPTADQHPSCFQLPTPPYTPTRPTLLQAATRQDPRSSPRPTPWMISTFRIEGGGTSSQASPVIMLFFNPSPRSTIIFMLLPNSKFLINTTFHMYNKSPTPLHLEPPRDFFFGEDDCNNLRFQ